MSLFLLSFMEKERLYFVKVGSTRNGIKTKKFVKKHKKAIIIGAAVVVAATIVICAVAAVSAAGAAAGAAGAAAASGSDKQEKNESKTEDKDELPPSLQQEAHIEIIPPITEVNEAPNLREALEEHILVFKERMMEDELQQAPIF